MQMTTKIIPVLLAVISAVTFANANDSIERDVLLNVVTGSANGTYKLIYHGDQGRARYMLLNEEGSILHDERLSVATDDFTFDVDQLELIGNDLEASLSIYIYNDRNELVYSGQVNSENVEHICDTGCIKSNWVSFVILSDNNAVNNPN